MTSWPLKPLGSIASIDRHGITPESIQQGSLYVGLENIERGGRIVGVEPTATGQLASTKFCFDTRHVLFGKLRPNLAKIARPNFDGICSTDILPLRPGPDLDRNYLAHFLALPEVVQLATSRAAGVNLPRLSPSELQNFRVPLPPIKEQRRIADILDRADAFRANRREAIGHLEELTQSIFLDMFGVGEFEITSAGALMPDMRNGLSPATAGSHVAQVLTLSAVTQGTFDPSAVKSGAFAIDPPSDQRVTARDFLICRGNGNKAFVGVGVYSTADRADLVFPDTVIAGRVDSSQVTLPYLEAAWRQPGVRRQIEAVARTTNGTYKVNQQTLSGVTLAVPPIERQEEFTRRATHIARHRKSLQSAVDGMNALFASVQQRAFSGSL